MDRRVAWVLVLASCTMLVEPAPVASVGHDLAARVAPPVDQGEPAYEELPEIEISHGGGNGVGPQPDRLTHDADPPPASRRRVGPLGRFFDRLHEAARDRWPERSDDDDDWDSWLFDDDDDC